MGKEKYPKLSKLNPIARKMVVLDIFSTIHRTYDLANRVLSFGRDEAWRGFAISKMNLAPGAKLLDIATGTGDMAIKAAKTYPGTLVEGIDIAQPMLEIGRRKVRKIGLENRISLTNADALSLPFPDESFDVSSIAFGMRNIPDTLQALKEMSRVTKVGGKIMVLEMTAGMQPWLKPLFGIYLCKIMPLFGGIIAGDNRAYHYLAESILKFPSPKKFKQLMCDINLSVTFFKLSYGIAYLHLGQKRIKFNY